MTALLAAGVASRLERVLAEPMVLDGHPVSIRASIGVASGPAAQAQALIRAADAAMYVTKRSTRRDRVPAAREAAD